MSIWKFGLCHRCFFTPGVAELYPRRDGAAPCEALSDAEILALPPTGIGDEDTPAPGPYVEEPEKPRVGDWRDNWKVPCGGFVLHPDTSPEAIHAAQLADVRDALAELGPGATAEEIGDRVCLPTWNVRRLLGELR